MSANDTVTHEIHFARIAVRDDDDLQAVLRIDFDLGCRPLVERVGGVVHLHVFGAADQVDRAAAAGLQIASRERLARVEDLDLGDGDRFACGATLPLGARTPAAASST